MTILDRTPRAWLPAAAALLVLSVAWLLTIPTFADPDLWGHLRFGLDHLEHGTLARQDPYSFMSDRPWINHEWLAEWIMAAAWTVGGPAGLVALKSLVILPALALAYAFLLTRGISPPAAGALVVVHLPILLPWIAGVRPQIFTYACFVVVMVAIAWADSGRRRVLWVLPPLFAAWANLHGGVLAGLAVLLLWLAARVVATLVGSRPAAGRLAPLALPVAAALATLLNPYGIGLWWFYRTALPSRHEILEWRPVELASLEGLVYGGILALAAAGWFWTRRPRSAPLLTVFLVLALAPLAARRHTPLFALCAFVLAGEHTADAVARAFEPITGRQAPFDPARVPRWTTLAFVLLSIVLVALAAPRWGRITYNRERYPVEAVRMLAASRHQGRLATIFNWGEYVIWHLGPQVKVSVDGRRETVYSEAALDENHRFAYGRGQWDALLARGDVDVALVPSQGWAVANLMRLQPGWTLVFEDDRSAIFVRTGSPAHALIAGTSKPSRASDELAFP